MTQNNCQNAGKKRPITIILNIADEGKELIHSNVDLEGCEADEDLDEYEDDECLDEYEDEDEES